MIQQSIPGYISEENNNTNLKRYMHPNIHSSSSYDGRDMGTPKCLSTNEWIKNMWYI